MSETKSTSTTEALKGSMKEAIGKLIGDGKVEAEGKAQQKTPKSDVKPKASDKA
ncbi:CsbD family protein [Methylobacterium sp. BTF04]|uniref:CsbD family protein n=1 Tax=Methylobacterium sp. BTF04 TaxID=2708300 RepID=UPI0013D3925D|nr:CsbD family protein [Methylobacterium sp. BTF04]NEU12774.1 CsbD family protein [Methylobacterium sp. BTF04]